MYCSSNTEPQGINMRKNNEYSRLHEESCQSKASLSMKYSPVLNHSRTQPNYLHFAPYGTSKPSSNTLKTTINQE